jgi:hypothetical protein
LTVALARQDAATLTQLTARLGLTTVDTLASTTAPLAHPGAVLTYRLYPGGTEYAPPVLQDMFGTTTLEDVPAGTLAPEPLTNPLGIFRSHGPLNLQSNVHLRGTLITDGSSPEVQVYGTNVVLEATDLPQLDGVAQRYQLPAALVRDDLRINNPSDTRLTGFAGVWDEFEIKRGSPTTQFEFRGSLLTNGLSLRGRDTWTMTATAWGNDLNDYNDAASAGGGLLGGLLQLLVNILNDIRAALGLGSSDTVYFPEWEQHQRGFTIQPTLTFAPGSSEVRAHWQDWTQPIYVKGPSDAGLRWELVRWEDGL